LEQGFSRKEICAAIGKSKSVLSRELKRNSDKRSGKYRADLAHRKYEQRQKAKPKKVHFTDEICKDIESLIRQEYSPEQAVGTLYKQGKPYVSIERIYQHVWAEKKSGGTLYMHLRAKGKRYRDRGASKDSRGIIANRRSIDDRPEVVDGRERFGDWEVDLVIGKGHKGALVTINERQVGYALVRKVKGKSSEEVSKAIVEALMPYKDFVNTITSDNGKEFASHEYIAESLETDYFFADPYCSWQRGSNENYNGLLRQYVPKKTDLDDFTDGQIAEIQDKLNRRPRKRLGFEEPNELFNQKVAFVT